MIKAECQILVDLQTKYLTTSFNFCLIEFFVFVQDLNIKVLKTIIEYHKDGVSQLKDH